MAISCAAGASAQGMRSTQEDRWVAAPASARSCSGYLLAVFDGHGGADVAQDARDAIIPLFAAALEQEESSENALRRTMTALAEKYAERKAGSTASVAFVSSDVQVDIAILGDSPVAWLGPREDIRIFPLHNSRVNLDERRSAIARGADYVGGYLVDPQRSDFGIQMSRALGDAELGRILSRTPEFYRLRGDRKSILLLGSDGLLNDLADAPRELTRLLRRLQQGATAKEIVEDALARRTGDNVTAAVWRAAL